MLKTFNTLVSRVCFVLVYACLPRMSTVAQRLLEARQAKGWSLRELARRAGVDAATLSHLERGHTEPSLEVVRRLSAALEMDPCSLAFSDSERPLDRS